MRFWMECAGHKPRQIQDANEGTKAESVFNVIKATFWIAPNVSLWTLCVQKQIVLLVHVWDATQGTPSSTATAWSHSAIPTVKLITLTDHVPSVLQGSITIQTTRNALQSIPHAKSTSLITASVRPAGVGTSWVQGLVFRTTRKIQMSIVPM